MKSKNKKIAVLMSGGVDSSVAALLLKKKGFNIIGVHLKISKFCNVEDEYDARRVAEILNFPIYTLDISEDYQKLVIDNLIKKYSQGLTPNPDIWCNSRVKFGIIFNFVRDLGFRYIATGHYAKTTKIGNNYFLKVPKDKNKDQTYFLWQINKNNLKNIIFPLANYEKEEVRKIAFDNKLPTAFKKDSQGICFLGKIKLSDYLKQFLPIKQGEIKDYANNLIGYHNGYYFYTEGQRHGLSIKNGQGPYYVALKDINTNTLIVAKENEEILYSSKILLNNINLLVNKDFLNKIMKKDKINVLVKCRYKQPFIRAIFDFNNNILQLKDKVKGVALGQSAVFYFKDIVLGGGIIYKKE